MGGHCYRLRRHPQLLHTTLLSWRLKYLHYRDRRLSPFRYPTFRSLCCQKPAHPRRRKLSRFSFCNFCTLSFARSHDIRHARHVRGDPVLLRVLDKARPSLDCLLLSQPCEFQWPIDDTVSTRLPHKQYRYTVSAVRYQETRIPTTRF